MPIDPAVAIGAHLPDRTFSWSEPDVQLYALAVGATDLRHALETHDLQVLPSFGIVAPSFRETAPPPLDLPGCELDLAQVVHGAQSISVTGPIPTSGTATLSTRISDVWDKGKAAVIWQEGVARSASGEELWTVRSSIFARGEGGFGGSRGSSAAVPVPDRAPDGSAAYDVTAQQALLYRLCGDRNPLHVDPEFATKAGFPAPILHGLCTYGIVLREVTDLLLDGDSHRVAAFEARFAGVVFPGETIHVDAWQDGDRIVVDATVGDDRRPALADCLVTTR
ncbi:MAG: MaoC/PaaZ C-terminal domain-containing protein [Nocardioides sp.]|uniref:MaoC/PaaZ C-terminal domain-containing protein n=1 Tax=Nocardioides sp. TaxID=35761 RepID=UPI00326345FB